MPSEISVQPSTQGSWRAEALVFDIFEDAWRYYYSLSQKERTEFVEFNVGILNNVCTELDLDPRRCRLLRNAARLYVESEIILGAPPEDT